MKLIDADFEEAHYTRMLFFPTPDVTESDKDKARVILDFLKMAKTVEPERKKGEWVNARDGYDGHVKCNKCFKTYDWTSDAQYFNFCPNCGSYNGGK